MARFRDPHIPLSSLHLLIPPLRMTSACMWQVALDRNVDRYDQLAEFISLVTEIVPGLLSYRQRTQLILGLRARVIVELVTKEEPVDCNAVQEHLNIFKKYKASHNHNEDQDQEVQNSKSAFVKQVQTLLKDKYEKDKFVKEVFPELYGARFDTVLQILAWEFLHRLDEFLPVPSFSKVSSFIDLSSFDSQFEQFFCNKDDLKRILQNQKQRIKLTKSEFSFMSDTILSTLASKQTSAASEGFLEGIKDEEGGGQSADEETDDSSVEISDSQWQDRGLSPLTDSPLSEEGGMTDENDDASSVVSQDTPTSLQVVYGTQVTLLEGNSEINIARVQEMCDPGMFKVNLATSLKDIEDLTCPVCYKTFGKPKAVKRHVKTAHPTHEQVFRCDKCDKTFQAKWRLDQHYQAHSIKKPYVCSHCGKGLSCPKVLETHMRLHTGERPYACKLCDKKFDQKYTLTQHIRMHSGEKPYLCSVCGKTFAIKGGLRVHTRQHTGERPYHCKECGESFRIFGALKRHQTLHTNERPYTCPQCGKSFRLQVGFARHMRIHTGEKPYQCVVCDKRFHTSGNRRIHMKSHKSTKDAKASTE
ncbi:zinc finger protein 239-like [Notolabrus celidotus]|uniref:zinc finger protein 239-like n=1 Tax=Notolabrus celidotus TaxID=1203425 RepID=UPI00148F4D4D|nr:zinc finger protein 239-like [Notolabrus celidotus]